MATLEFEATGNGFRARLRRSRLGQVVESALLLAWLAFWGVAEVAALLAVAGAMSQLFGLRWFGRFGEPPRSDPAIIILFLGFLFFWLTLWTFGGVGALRALFRALSTTEVL